MERTELLKLMEEANSTLRSIDFKGKDYVEVNERIKAFRYIYPNGSIETEIVSLQDGVVVMKATCKDENGKVLSTAHAYEKEGSTFINKTSFIENCCTSATGRAIGYLGIGINQSVASAEEVQNAVANQDKSDKISKKTWELLNRVYTKEEIKEMYKEFGITKGSDLKEEYAYKKYEDKVKSTKIPFDPPKEGGFY